MTEWAILYKNRILNVVTCSSRIGAETTGALIAANLGLPDYQVADLYNLPSDVQQAYQYWDERP